MESRSRSETTAFQRLFVPELCQKGDSCKGTQAPEVFCINCNAFQCGHCCTLYHLEEDCLSHIRVELNEKRPCRQLCNGRNEGVLYCTACGKFICSECDQALHQGKRSGHQRITFSKVSRTLASSTEHRGSHFESGKIEGGMDEMRVNNPVAKQRTGQPPKPTITFPSNTSSEDLLKEVHSDFGQEEKKAVKLLNDKEELMVGSSKELLGALECLSDGKYKVVSIFGNTGDGKSYTLNHTFFHGQNIFKTSASPDSCTVGIWAAYCPDNEAIFIDTEGLLGTTKDENKRLRMLMKVLAISDLVIYRTRAERLHNDMFIFLADASEAYHRYFAGALKAVNERGNLDMPISALGPSVVVFHETHHTDVLGVYNQASLGQVDWGAVGEQDSRDTPKLTIRGPEECLRTKFIELNRIPKAYSSIRYVGTRTSLGPTNFSKLGLCVAEMLRDNSVRASRPLQVIFSALEILNQKFSGEISNFSQHTFPDEFFTCGTACLSCNVHCDLSMNHQQEGLRHCADSSRCRYQAQFDNQIYLCKKCDNEGEEALVVPKSFEANDGAWLGMAKYAWSGFVLECPRHGVIFRSRQYWYGNKNPEEKAVKTAIRHVWPGELNACGEGTHNAGRRLIEGVSSLAGAIGNVAAVPSRKVSSWMADQIAPAYWQLNSSIVSCGSCEADFQPTDTKHHCRACGHGFCQDCVAQDMPVPWRGWGSSPVKVCQPCFSTYHKSSAETPPAPGDNKQSEESQEHKVTARYVGEIVHTATQYVGGAMSYSKNAVVDAVRPSYWSSDTESHNCSLCKAEFSDKLLKHHCRACGQVFCNDCSLRTKAVPSRGWDTPVRVCDSCAVKPDL